MNPRDPLLDTNSRENRVGRVLRERWYVVVLIAGACLIGALAISLNSPKKYQASSRLLFQEDSFGAALFGNNLFQTGGTDPSRTAQTNVDTVSSIEVASRVKSALRLSESPQDLLDQMSASSETNADIVTITITDTDPALAARIANSWASQFIALRQQEARGRVGQAIADMRAKLNALPPDATTYRSEYAQQLAKLQALQAVQFGNVQPSDTASVPNSPVSPKPQRDGIVGLLLGLVLGIGVALVLDRLDKRIKSVDELEAVYERPVIGLVPERAFKPRTETDRRRSIEAFRAVREGLSVFAVSKSSPVFVVTSAVSSEGKTTVAINLARVLAMSGERVMLIEADLRRPSLAQHTGRRASRDGLTGALLHDVPLPELVIQDRTGLENLHIIPSGTSVPFAAELLASPKMASVLDQARELADVVIVDAPPLLPVADTRSLINLPSVDGVLLVARLYSQTTDQAKRVTALLEQRHIQEARLIATSAPEEAAYGYDEAYDQAAANVSSPARRLTPAKETTPAPAQPAPEGARPSPAPARVPAPAAAPVRGAAPPRAPAAAPAPARARPAAPAQPAVPAQAPAPARIPAAPAAAPATTPNDAPRRPFRVAPPAATDLAPPANGRGRLAAQPPAPIAQAGPTRVRPFSLTQD